MILELESKNDDNVSSSLSELFQRIVNTPEILEKHQGRILQKLQSVLTDSRMELSLQGTQILAELCLKHWKIIQKEAHNLFPTVIKNLGDSQVISNNESF